MTETPIATADKQRLRILLVDDAPQVVEAVNRFLTTQDNLEVVGTARDGVEALEKVEELAPDLVLIDFQMPRLNGLQASFAITHDYPAVKVVMMTIDDSSETRRAARSQGVHGFVAKANLHRDLLQEIRRVLEVKQ